ncbi:transmembrane protein, putative [Medicago truncatula]|uniref:Transmembrane protein, putative n=1 Tax=Medicago truncatula TaxID=3880 RepID=A0A072V2T4_MEDTR|nr:transmembrane protein, putative [Medicago truncatula]
MSARLRCPIRQRSVSDVPIITLLYGFNYFLRLGSVKLWEVLKWGKSELEEGSVETIQHVECLAHGDT